MEPRLGCHVQMMIAAKYVMTNRNNVVERAGGGEKNNDKGKRENNPAVVFFHPRIENGHNRTPGSLIRLPRVLMLPRSRYVISSPLCAPLN